jgi:L-ascorbate metabolism protein UlaG (beta-lactamase superfamily)
VKRVALACIAGFVAIVCVLVALAWQSLGKSASGPLRARMEKSPQWHDGAFENPEPLVNDALGSLTGAFDTSPFVSPPDGTLAPAPLDPSVLAVAPPSGLRITWLGHASALIEIDGARVLTDPVWSERASPYSWIGPRRWYAPPIALAQLPPIDAVVLSHDHYDHLDMRTMQDLARIADERGWPTKFIAPLGIGAHLAYWGVPQARIVDVDWWDATALASPHGDVVVHTVPARHASGRHVLDKDATLWAGAAIVGPAHRVYFSGDTGLFSAMKKIGEDYGPFDVTMIEVGQYHAAWPDWHIGPERAVRDAHALVRGRVFVPIHWALFTLAYHGWTEPVERVLAAASLAQVPVIAPRPGEPIEPPAIPASAPTPTHWWPDVAWLTAEQAPVARPGER